MSPPSRSPFVRQPTTDRRRPWNPRGRRDFAALIETLARKTVIREAEALDVERAMPWPDRIRYVLGVAP